MTGGMEHGTIDVRTWRRLRRRIHHALYDDMVGTVGCGPFDGGCVLFARALQAVVGGEVHVVVRPSGRADHAAVLHEGRLWDYDGPSSPARFLKRFNRAEQSDCTSWRPYRDGDLPEAVADVALEARTAALLRIALSR